jgi:hypothetical protein
VHPALPRGSQLVPSPAGSRVDAVMRGTHQVLDVRALVLLRSQFVDELEADVVVRQRNSCCAVGRLKPRRVSPAMNVSLGTNLNVPEPVRSLSVPSISSEPASRETLTRTRTAGVRHRAATAADRRHSRGTGRSMRRPGTDLQQDRVTACARPELPCAGNVVPRADRLFWQRSRPRLAPAIAADRPGPSVTLSRVS